MNKSFIALAIQLALDNIGHGGGPFGAVITRNNEIIATGTNQVTNNNDPTAHAEIMAIRNACQTLGSYQLTDCQIFVNCEPCPMCLGAIYWARISKLFFATSRHDAAALGFSDEEIYNEISRPLAQRKIITRQIKDPKAHEIFTAWSKNTVKIDY